jgi:hypothetical protein
MGRAPTESDRREGLWTGRGESLGEDANRVLPSPHWKVERRRDGQDGRYRAGGAIHRRGPMACAVISRCGGRLSRSRFPEPRGCRPMSFLSSSLHPRRWTASDRYNRLHGRLPLDGVVDPTNSSTTTPISNHSAALEILPRDRPDCDVCMLCITQARNKSPPCRTSKTQATNNPHFPIVPHTFSPQPPTVPSASRPACILFPSAIVVVQVVTFILGLGSDEGGVLVVVGQGVLILVVVHDLEGILVERKGRPHIACLAQSHEPVVIILVETLNAVGETPVSFGEGETRE